MADVYIKTHLAGKINNLTLSQDDALLPLFEAVVNSIHAIEDRKDQQRGKIKIIINRERDFSPPLIEPTDEEDKDDKEDEEESRSLRKIKSFTVEDTGIGFDEANYNSFNVSDSTYKMERGGKGVGRFFWLKAFDKVEIESIYRNNGTKHIRKFNFNKKKGIIPIVHQPIDIDKPQLTTVKLIGFKEEYRTSPKAFKTTVKIAQRILEHCLSYYIGEAAPSIEVVDGNEVISLDEEYNKIKQGITTESVDILGEQFCLNHIKLYGTYAKVHKVVLCANKRNVIDLRLHSLLSTSQLFDPGDPENPFYYCAYVSSDYLNQHVDSSRRSFDLPKEGNFHKFDDGVVISINTIRNEITEKIKVFLADYLTALREMKQERVSKHVEINPMLRSVPHYCPSLLDEIEPNTSDEKLNEVLYKYKGTVEYAIQLEAERLLKTQVRSIGEIEDRYKEISEQIVSFKRDDLASVICKRKLIIELFEKKLQLNREGKYENEEIIHDILFPRRTTTDEITYKDHNLWIIDEQLTFHRFAASDKELRGYSSSKSQKRADIIIFAEIGSDGVCRAVSIIELKKPVRERYEKDPVDQIIETIEDIQNQVVKTRGRPFILDKSTKYYCYAICDITEEIKRTVKKLDMIELKDNLGYYIYHKGYNAYIEVIAYDQITADAKRRNAIFFDALGINRELIDWNQ